MTTVLQPRPSPSSLSTRLSQLAPLDDRELAALHGAEREARRHRARSELMREGEPIRERRALLSGWACRQRILIEGQRQVLSFLLPGDLMGACHHPNPLAATTVVTVTEAMTCALPDAEPGTALAAAIARSGALEEHHLMAQITRLGRLDAYQRIVDWLLETCDRLLTVGLATPSEFPMPLTQELLADTLGLTSVHVNRMIQALRRDGLLASRGGVFTLPDRRRLEKLVDYKRARVSSDG